MLLRGCWVVVLLTTVTAMPKPPGGIRETRSAPARLGSQDVANFRSSWFSNLGTSIQETINDVANSFDDVASSVGDIAHIVMGIRGQFVDLKDTFLDSLSGPSESQLMKIRRAVGNHIGELLTDPWEKIKTKRAPKVLIKLVDLGQKYLHKYGHMSKTKMSRIAELAVFDEKNLKSSIRSFQKLSGLTPTGKLDEKTLQYMTLPRCGVEDTVGTITPDVSSYKVKTKFVPKRKRRGRKRGNKRGKGGKRNKKGKSGNRTREDVAKSRQKRYNVQGSSWDKKVLTYQIKSYTSDMKRKEVRSAIHRALQVWAKHSALQFKRVDTDDADIKISFGSRSHGDSYPFDGKGGTLAHAFFPQSGEAHFDEDEFFSPKGEGTNLMIVAAHEFGHSLGLGHSSVPNSLMAPFYQGYVEDFDLHPDDIAGIQSIYGKNVDKNAERKKRPTVPPKTTIAPRTTKKPRPRTEICTTHIDAMIQYGYGTDRTIVFKGPYFYRLDRYGIKGEASKIGRKWKGVPGNLNAAAHSYVTGYTYFFKGALVYSYRGDRARPGFPKNASDLGLPSHPTAALTYGRNGLIYVFKRKNFYTFYESIGMVYDRRPYPIQKAWPGIPENIDAAVTWHVNGKTYFMKGNDYYRFNEQINRVDADYPKNMNEMWLGCRRKSGSSRLRSKPAARARLPILARLIAKSRNATSTD